MLDIGLNLIFNCYSNKEKHHTSPKCLEGRTLVYKAYLKQKTNIAKILIFNLFMILH